MNKDEGTPDFTKKAKKEAWGEVDESKDALIPQDEFIVQSQISQDVIDVEPPKEIKKKTRPSTAKARQANNGSPSPSPQNAGMGSLPPIEQTQDVAAGMFQSEILPADNVSQKSQDLDTYSNIELEKEMARRGLATRPVNSGGSGSVSPTQGRTSTVSITSKKNMQPGAHQVNLSNMIPKYRKDQEKLGGQSIIVEGEELDLRDRNQLKLSNSIFKREPCPLDHDNAFTAAELATPSSIAPRTAEHNKEQYLKSYSVGFEIPSFYVLESTIWFKNPDYVLQMVKYVIPENETLKVIQHSAEGNSDITTLQEEFEKHEGNLWLRALKVEPGTIETDREVQIRNCRWAMFELSPNCKWFAMVIPIEDGTEKTRKNHYIFIYEVSQDDPQHLLDLIKRRQYQYRYSDKDMEEDLSFMKELQFDDTNKKLIGIGDLKFFVLDFIQGSISVHSLQEETYEKILHLDYVSSANPDSIESRDYCYICAKVNQQLQIQVFDFFEPKDSDEETGKSNRNKNKTSLEDAAKQIADNRFKSFKIDFQTKPSELFQFRMSQEKDCIFFGDFEEKFVIDIDANGSSKKRKLRHMDNKIIRFIEKDPCNKGFYVICSKEYDNCLELEHTHRDEIEIEFPRQVEPGIIRIFDMQISQEKIDDDKSQICLQFVGMMDDVFTIDKTTYKEQTIKQKNEMALTKYIQYDTEQENLTSSVVTAFSINWPYVCFSGLEDYLVIYNCFQREYLHRVQLVDGGEKISIQQTYITDTNDLYAMVQNGDYYYLYEIDLDAQEIEKIEELESNQNSLYYMGRRQPILQYSSEVIDYKLLHNMIVRGSSRKQQIDFDEKLIVVLLHGMDLYIWVKHMGESHEVRRMIKIATLCSKNLCQMNDSVFYVMVDNLNRQEIHRIYLNYSSFQKTVTYVEEHVSYTVLEFNFDHISNKVLLVCVDWKNAGSWDDEYYLKIFDIETDQVDAEIRIESTQLIGRLLSGLYTFVGGHIYYNNNVIKLRYDLVTSPTAHKYTEEELFDEYFDIFKLDKTFKVRSNTPLDSILSHRFAYIIQDKSKTQCMQVMVVPYLHEKKVYLNEIKANTDYFYTSIETAVTDEEHYNTQLFELYQKLGVTDAEDQERDLKSDAYDSQMPVLQSYTAVICLNLSENIFDVYSQNGLLLHQLDYSEHVNKYGEPIAVSNNGQNFIFKLSERTLLSMSQKGIIKDEKQMIVKCLTVSVMNLSAYGFCHIKDISFRSAIKDCLKLLKNEELGDFMEFKNKNKWMFLQTYEEIKNAAHMEFAINDEMDVCIKLQERPENPKAKHKTVYYIENCCYNIDLDQIKKVNGHCLSFSMEQHLQNIVDNANTIESNIYYSEEVENYGFRLNYNYLFIFDKHKVIYMDINLPFSKDNMQHINLKIDPQETECYIYDIRVGCSDVIAIIIAKEDEYTVYSWNIIENAENDVYDVGVDFEVLWDGAGRMYIIDGRSLILTNERMKSRCFTFQDISTFRHQDLGIEKGIRVDGKNHNWVILEQYLAIPFSYMSFVIKQTIEDGKEVVKVFDPEPYNYIFNRSTSFLDGNFVKTGYSELENVLQNFESIDPLMLDILHYTQDVEVMKEGLVDLLNPLTQTRNLVTLVQKMIKKYREKRSNKIVEAGAEEQVELEEDPVETTAVVATGGTLGIEINSPLHMAIKQGNNRSVEIILNYMSIIDTNNSYTFRDIFAKLMEYNKVKSYISELPRSSQQMEKKQVLKIKSPMSKEIIQMSESNTLYVDQLFYTQNMGEDVYNTSYSSYPVKVVALRVGWMLKSDDDIDGRYFLTEIMRSEDLSFYNMKSLRMIIEFLYQKIKFRIIIYLLPVFLGNQILFIISAMINEAVRANIKKDPKNPKMMKGNDAQLDQTTNLIIVLMFNLLAILLQAYINYLILKGMGAVFFKRLWSWVDITTLILNFIVLNQYWTLVSYQDKDGYFSMDLEQYKTSTTNLRINIVMAQMVLFWKSQYFLSIVDKIAPLVGIFVQIIIDIVWFLFILIIFCFSFSFSFFLLAQNQLNFDGLTADEKDGLSYGTFLGSFNYVCNLLIGESDTAPFDLGTKTMKPLLQLIFWMSCFIIMIHMMNMLIAIMGNTFSERNEVVDQIKYKEHLVFVIDNWFMRNLAFKDIRQVKYIITAFSTEEDEPEDEAYQYLVGSLSDTTEVIINNQKKQESKINEVQTMISRQDQLIKDILQSVVKMKKETFAEGEQLSQNDE